LRFLQKAKACRPATTKRVFIPRTLNYFSIGRMNTFGSHTGAQRIKGRLLAG
jgi:hypothetical protein